MRRMRMNGFLSGKRPSFSPVRIVSLEFDGARTCYDGELLRIGDVVVQPSGLEDARVCSIVAALNRRFAGRNIRFTAGKPRGGEYSTIFVGRSDVFAEYGDFLGLAERIGGRNANAFVFLDRSSGDAGIVSVIAHETGHLLGDSHAVATGTLVDYAAVFYENDVFNDLKLSADSFGTVSSNFTYNGNIGPDGAFINSGDNDWFCFTAGVSGTVTLRINASAGKVTYYLNGTYYYCYSGQPLTVNITKGADYYFTVSSRNASYGYSYSVTGTFSSGGGGGGTSYPDLMISSFSASATSITTSQGLTLSFTVKNNGSASAGASTAYIYDGSTRVGTVSVGSLSAGGSVSKTYVFSAGTLGAGTHNLSVKADGGLAVTESGEANNTSATVAVTVTAPAENYPDLIISSISASATSITTSQGVTLAFTVKNTGGVSAGASTAYIYDGSTRVGTVSVGSLSAGSSSSKTYVFSAGALGAGTHSLFVKADGGLEVAESSGTNNTSSTVTVRVSVPLASDLTFYKRSGWSSSVIVHQAAGQFATVLDSAAKSYLDVCIQNKGKGDADSASAYVYIDDAYYTSFSVASLSSGYSSSRTNVDLGTLSAGKHKITVRIDPGGSLDESNVKNNIISKTVTVKDATSPGQVGSISSRQENYNVVLSWNAVSDNVKVGKYQVSWWNAGGAVSKTASSSKTAYTIKKLAPGSYYFTVTAIDSSKNYGQSSNVYQITVRDVTAPGAVSVKSKVTGNTVDLSWKAPKDNVGVSGYILKYGAGLEHTVNLSAGQTAYQVTGVAQGTFQYQIFAVDAAGNAGKASVKKAVVKTPLVVLFAASSAGTENFASATPAAETGALAELASRCDGTPSLDIPASNSLAASGVSYGEVSSFALPDPGVYTGGNSLPASVAALQFGEQEEDTAVRGLLA